MRSSRILGKGAIVALIAVVLTAGMLTTAAAGMRTDVGTLENPVRLSAVGFSAESQQNLVFALEEATNLEFVVVGPTDAEEAVGWMCGEYSDSSMQYMGSVEYVFAYQDCRAKTRHQLVINGSDRFWTQFLVPRYSVLQTLDDLNGLNWSHVTKNSISGYIVPKGMLTMADVEVNEVLAGNHTDVAQAVYNNADSGEAPIFGTTFLDVRRVFAEQLPSDIFDKTRIMAISQPIPNSPVVFGPDFPANLQRRIERALKDLPDPEGTIYGGLTNLDTVKKKDFKFLRAAVEAAGIDLGDL